MTLRSRDLLLLTTLALAVLLAACGGDTTRNEPAGEPAAGVPATDAPAAPVATAADAIPERILVLSKDKAEATVFKLSGDRPQLTLRGDDKRTLIRRRKGKDVHWVERGKGAVFTVRGSGGKGFSLHDADGALLWRMRVGHQRIQAFSGEEKEDGEPAFVLRRPRENVVKTVDRAGEVVGSAVFTKTGRLRVSDASGQLLYKSAKAPASGMFGVLLVADMDPVLRDVLMAEILLHKG